VRISAKADYAVRALAELAARPDSGPVSAAEIGRAQQIPVRFLLTILNQLQAAGLVRSQRGATGGWSLARPARTITLADVIRTVDGPLANVQGARPDEVSYPGPAAILQEVWVALRASMRTVLETVTVADLALGKLPAKVARLAAAPDAWRPH